MLKDKDILNACKDHVLFRADFIKLYFQEKIGLEIVSPSYKDINNVTRKIDQQLHNEYLAWLKQMFGNEVVVTGEEVKSTKKQLRTNWRNWIKASKIVASIDAVDGTDLVFRELSNWCTALFFFKPNDSIIASLVGVPGKVYYASEEGAGKTYFTEEKKTKGYGQVKRGGSLRIKGDRPSEIRNAAVSFYGQKAANLLSLFGKENFIKFLEKLKRQSDQSQKHQTRVDFRIYNLGGNPMMMKLIEGAIDVVIELKGQKLYDVIPGAYIAQKAGAYWGDLAGNEITREYLRDNFLSSPDPPRLCYILAATKKLYDDLLGKVI